MLESAFLDALSRAGIPPNSPLVLDGNLRRYNVQGDKKGRRNGWYRFVKVRHDFAWGVFGCNKRGISDKWLSKDKSEVTQYDQKLVRKKQGEIEKQREALQARVAVKAAEVWGRLREVHEHEYLARKNVKSYGLRELHTALALPVFVDNFIASMQFIFRDGEKRFLLDGLKKGGYCPIGEPTDIMYIAEGYATAASIHEALGAQVIVAFDAYNILPVAEAMRAAAPDKRIIIAADNDQWTKGNPGISWAQQAADKIGATILWPRFNPEDPSRPTDWNDYHRMHGLKALADELRGINKTAQTIGGALVPDEKKWRGYLLEGKEQKPGYPLFDPKSKQNAYLFLENHEHFKSVLAYNSFADEVILLVCPPYEDPQFFTPRRIAETDAAQFVRWLENLGIRTNKEIVWDYMQILAKRNTINPARDYLERLHWDGTPRLEHWLAMYLGARRQPEEYLRAVGICWLVGAVARIYRPGVKFDYVLTLEGRQGIKKTTAFRTLSTFGEESYFLEFSGAVGHKDTGMLMQGKMIVEMAELATLLKSGNEEVKTFLSRQEDEYRPPYAKTPVKRKRHFIFGASTNNEEDDEYLTDPTGARRLWPVACGGDIDIAALARDKDQLWAEAVAAFKAGAQFWLNEEEEALARIEQSGRREEDILQPKVIQSIEKIGVLMMEITTDKVLDHMDYRIEQRTPRLKKRIKDCLKELGYAEKKASRLDHRRVWRKKDAQ